MHHVSVLCLCFLSRKHIITHMPKKIKFRAFDDDTRQITDGRQILVRMFDLLVDTISRDDLDDMLMLNDLLAWRTQAAEHVGAPLADFPIESFNAAPGAASRPYEIALIAPAREDADPSTIFDVPVM